MYFLPCRGALQLTREATQAQQRQANLLASAIIAILIDCLPTYNTLSDPDAIAGSQHLYRHYVCHQSHKSVPDITKPFVCANAQQLLLEQL